MVSYIDVYRLMMLIVVATIPLLLLVRRADAPGSRAADVGRGSLQAGRAG
jgi:hypothetical protein